MSTKECTKRETRATTFWHGGTPTRHGHEGNAVRMHSICVESARQALGRLVACTSRRRRLRAPEVAQIAAGHDNRRLTQHSPLGRARFRLMTSASLVLSGLVYWL